MKIKTSILVQIYDYTRELSKFTHLPGASITMWEGQGEGGRAEVETKMAAVTPNSTSWLVQVLVRGRRFGENSISKMLSVQA